MNTEIIEAIRVFIERDGLNKPNRKRHQIYKKAYLQHKLKACGLTLKAIADMFKMTHASVINNIKTHHLLTQYHKNEYDAYIYEYLEALDGYKLEPKTRNLIDDINNCANLYQLNRVKRWIREKKYEIDATLLE
jgi:hypothetical protein